MNRVVRGGSWGMVEDTWLRCAYPCCTSEVGDSPILGFRTFRPARIPSTILGVTVTGPSARLWVDQG